MKPTDAERLGLALNFSVFYYDILAKPDAARRIAKKAFDEALEGMDSLTEESYSITILVMQLLRDNLILWANDDDSEKDI